MTTVGYTPVPARGRARRLGIALCAAGAALAGAFILGRVTVPGSTASTPTPVGAPSLTLRDGVPVPNRNTQSGAATAAADFQTAGFRVLAGTVAAGPAQALLLGSDATPAARQVLAAPGTGSEPQTRSSYAPLSLTVRTWRPEAAQVGVWGVQTTSSPGHNTADWGTSVVSLRWEQGQWRVVDQTFISGPWPIRSDDRMATASGDWSFRTNELAGGWTYVPEP